MISVRQALDKADDLWARSGHNMNALSPAIRSVYLIGQLEFETSLGGVVGWLTSSSGKHASETAAALDTVGARECAAIIRQILAFFPGGSPAADDSVRVQQVQRLLPTAEGKWRELGDALLAWPNDVDALLGQYVTLHHLEFTQD
jgi:hypothetical protein